MTLQETLRIETAAITKYAVDLATVFNAASNPTADQKRRCFDLIKAYARGRLEKLNPFLDAIETELMAKSFTQQVAARAKASNGANKSQIRSQALDAVMAENPVGYHAWRLTECRHPLMFT
jgi:hypothetical protein